MGDIPKCKAVGVDKNGEKAGTMVPARGNIEWLTAVEKCLRVLELQ